MENRITDLEMCVSRQEKALDELSDEVFRLSKQVEALSKQMKLIIAAATQEAPVKPQSEETPPPHY